MKCSNDWCSKPAKVRGWCNNCYSRFQNGKDPTTKPRPKAPKNLALEDRLSFRGWTVIQRNTPYAEGPCWEWGGSRDRKGYGTLSLPPKTTVFAHRLAYTLWVSDPGDAGVLHHCDNPPCINPKHLWLGTTKDNLQDMTRKERGNTVKLTATEVAELRRREYRRGCNVIWAKEFGVSPSTISAARTGVTWRHL